MIYLRHYPSETPSPHSDEYADTMKDVWPAVDNPKTFRLTAKRDGVVHAAVAFFDLFSAPLFLSRYIAVLGGVENLGSGSCKGRTSWRKQSSCDKTLKPPSWMKRAPLEAK